MAVDKLVESFLHPVVTPIVRMTMHNTLVNRIYQISSKTALTKTTLGSGKLRSLALTVSPKVYANLSATYVMKPSNPGPEPLIPTETTRVEQTTTRYKLTLDTELYTLLHNLDKALKQQLLGSVEDIYVRHLKEKYVGYRNLTCLEVINHLKANYYKVTLTDLKDNTAHMNAPHNINEPFESINEKIETAVDFTAAGKVPYTPYQVVTTTYYLIFAMGYFTAVCCRWNQKPVASKTWEEFKIYFAE